MKLKFSTLKIKRKEAFESEEKNQIICVSTLGVHVVFLSYILNKALNH